jgi:hypothetical protein
VRADGRAARVVAAVERRLGYRPRDGRGRLDQHPGDAKRSGSHSTSFAAKLNGVLDDRFGRVAPDDPAALSLGGSYTLSTWPERSSWDFVAVGRGHDVDFWTGFLRALAKVDPDMAVNIEHEDQELDQLEGLRLAAETLRSAASRSS